MDITDMELAGLFTRALIEGNCQLTSNRTAVGKVM